MTIAVVPPDFTVWAVSDIHGQHAALVTALRRAGITDDAGRWAAPKRTALVGLGDYIDRGPASLSVLSLLVRLRKEAASRGSLVILCLGNHEAALLATLDGRLRQVSAWLTMVGGPAAAAAGLGLTGIPLEQTCSAILRACPEIAGVLRAMFDAVAWRDVLLCHAGPVARTRPNDLGRSTDAHLWQLSRFDDPEPSTDWNVRSPAFRDYQLAGHARFVLGHVVRDGLVACQAGSVLMIDTNAGNLRTVAGGSVSLVHLGSTGPLAARCVSVVV